MHTQGDDNFNEFFKQLIGLGGDDRTEWVKFMRGIVCSRKSPVQSKIQAVINTLTGALDGSGSHASISIIAIGIVQEMLRRELERQVEPKLRPKLKLLYHAIHEVAIHVNDFHEEIETPPPC